MLEKIGREQIHEIITSNLPIGFSIVDENGIIVDFNEAAEEITGFTKAEVIGNSHFLLLHGSSDLQKCPLLNHALQKREETIESESRISKKNGEQIVISVTAFPLIDDEGNFFGGVELFRDITARKKLEQERQNMLSMFAHDVINPATTSNLLISRILAKKAGEITEKQKDYLEIVNVNLGKVEYLINKFLEFSRLEAKEYTPDIESYDIASAIKKFVASITVEADKKHIKIIYSCSEKCPDIIPADPTMIDRVITNLLYNALKFSAPGGTIKVQLSEGISDVIVHVTDSGQGIPEEQLPYIFDAFFRASRDSQGSGLGLAITKTIVEAHDGRIYVASLLGEGSTFSFCLPKQRSAL